MPIDKLCSLNQGGYFYHLINHYWPITETEEVIFYGSKNSPYSHPQCNRNELIAIKAMNSVLIADSGIVVKEVRLIPIAFQPINISDYQY